MEERNYSEEVASQIDAEVRAIVDSCYANAFHLLETNIDKLHRLAEALLEKETVEADEVDRLLSDGPRPIESRPATPESAVPDTAAAASAKPAAEKPRPAPKGLPFPPPEPA